MKSWYEVQGYVTLHSLPFRVERFNMSLRGCLSATGGEQNGKAIAWTVKDAVKVVRATHRAEQSIRRAA